MKLNNKYYLLRHGEAVSNVKNILSSWPEQFENPLTEHGVAMVKEAAATLHGKGIEIIFCSDILRTQQTAEIIGKALGLAPIPDARLREINFGEFNGKEDPGMNLGFASEDERVAHRRLGGESYEDVRDRVMDFLQDSEKSHEGKNILVVSHECPLWILESQVRGFTLQAYLKMIPKQERIKKAEVRTLN